MIQTKINELLKYVFSSKEFKILYNILPNKSIPYQNYIGVNFDDKDIISIKLYFSFFEKPDDAIINEYLPDTSGYYKYIDLYEPTNIRTLENNGITLTLKVNSLFEIKKGYHFRIDKNSLNFPKIKSFNCNPDDLVNIGICEEFDKEELALIKHYYYFDKLNNKEKFSSRFNKAHGIKADLIEYTESDKFNKLITCNLSGNEFYQKFLSYNSSLSSKIDELFVNKYGFNGDIAHGFYENKNIEAKYYFKLDNANQSYNLFLLKENFHIDTITPLLNNFL